MMLLPKKIGPVTLTRRLGSDGVAEAFAAVLDEPAGKQVVARRVLPWVLRAPARLAGVEARVNDLTGIRHPVLVSVTEYREVGEERFVVEDVVDAVDLGQVLTWCREQGKPIPHNIFLNLATQICNGIEALHGRPGKASGAEHVLHLALRPEAILVTAEGKVVVGGYGLVRSPTSLPQGASPAPDPSRIVYLSPEQTHQDQKLTPASDIFTLGSVLYELLTLEPLFRAESSLQTIHRIRRAEVTTPLMRVKELLPGLDKVLYRALSLNPRHRYQRAFVLREDLRGLMSGFSFSRIADETRAFVAPLFDARGRVPEGGVDEAPPAGAEDGFFVSEESTDVGLENTAALIRRAQGDPRGPSPSTLIPEDNAFDDDPLPARETTAEVDPPTGGVNTTWVRQDDLKQKAAPKPASDEPKVEHTSWRPRSTPAKPAPAPPPPPSKPPPEAAPPRASEFNEDATTHKDARAPASRTASAPPPPPRPEVSDSGFQDDVPPPRSGAGAALAAMGGVGVLAVAAVVCIGGASLIYAFMGSPDDPPVVAAATEPAEVVASAAEVTSDEAEPPAEAVAAADNSSGQTPRSSTPRQAATHPQPTPTTTRTTPTATPTAAAGQAARSPTRQPTSGGTATFQLEPPPTVESDEQVDLGPSLGDLAEYSDRAHRGTLSDNERITLEAVPDSDPDYTRARVLLYQDAKARNDQAGRRRHLDLVMALPENQYNPALLVEQAELHIGHEQYAQALERANLAERHWARLPSDLIFSRKAMIFEIQAASWQGIFYQSGGDDLDALHSAIRSWERYRRHVQDGSRTDLSAKADDQLAKLYDMRRRLE